MSLLENFTVLKFHSNKSIIILEKWGVCVRIYFHVECRNEGYYE